MFSLTSSKMLGQTTSYDLASNNFITHIVAKQTAFDEQPYSFSFFEPDFNFISYRIKNMRLGINGFFEEDLPDNNIKLTDFFIYNFGFDFTMKQFQISLFFENYFNINKTELSIEPTYVANNNTLVYLEHDTPSMIRLSLVYSF